jgi:hypothetical protein
MWYPCDKIVVNQELGLYMSWQPKESKMPTPSSTTGAIQLRAAVRFPLHLTFVLRTQDREYAAVTEDVSANGVLFSAEEVPGIGAKVAFNIAMPAAVMGGARDVLLHCAGRIVRHAQANGKKMAAAVIDEYTLKADTDE